MRTVLYMRMSTDKQENSIESQLNILNLYAKTNRMKIIDKYVDEGISGRTAEKRPAFIRMIDDSAKDLFDAVLVYDSSRFARNLEESIVYKSILKKNNVSLISATEPTLDDDSALLTDAMLGALNEMYSRKLSKAVKRGMVFKARQGFYQTPPPYGYTKKNSIMSVNIDESEIVKKIFALFIESPSWHSVAVKLNNMNIPKRNSYGWYSRDIKRILTNVAYIGYVYYDKQIYKGQHEPIISTELWDAVQELISVKPVRRSRPETTYKHWLSGILICAHCGGRMNHVTDNKGNTSYRCSKYANGCCKYSNFMSVPKLEILTRKALEALISNDRLDFFTHVTLKTNLCNEVQILQTSLKKTEAKLERHKQAYSNGVDTLEEYKENKQNYQKEKAELLKQLEELSSLNNTSEKNAKLRSSATTLIDVLFSEKYSVEQKSLAIHSIIDKIVFNKNSGAFTVFYFL